MAITAGLSLPSVLLHTGPSLRLHLPGCGQSASWWRRNGPNPTHSSSAACSGPLSSSVPSTWRPPRRGKWDADPSLLTEHLNSNHPHAKIWPGTLQSSLRVFLTCRSVHQHTYLIIIIHLHPVHWLLAEVTLEIAFLLIRRQLHDWAAGVAWW